MLDSIAALLNAVAAALTIRGNRDMADLLRVGAALLTEGDDARQEIQEIAEDLEQRVKEQRGYTGSELHAFRARRDELLGIIGAVDVPDDDDDQDDDADDDDDDENGEGSPVADVNLAEAKTQIAASEDPVFLEAVVAHDTRKGARESATARLEELVS